jgi:hypothetical protein
VKSQLKYYTKEKTVLFQNEGKYIREGKKGGQAYSASISGHVCGDVSFVTSLFSCVSFRGSSFILALRSPARLIDCSLRLCLQNVLRLAIKHSGGAV